MCVRAHAYACACRHHLRFSHIEKKATEGDEAQRERERVCVCRHDLRFSHIEKKATEDDEAHRPLKPVVFDDGFCPGSVSRYSAVSGG